MAADRDAAALAFLESRINYETRGMPAGQELRLDRIARLLERLGDPHRQYRVVHVAGTKGKGSVCAMVAALLRSAGVSVGLHTSPHLLRLGERFLVDGAEPRPGELAERFDELRPHADAVDAALPAGQPPLTYFELTTAAAFLHFARRRVAWAVIEVGMGGRLDATNVVDPAVAAIARIALDHTQQLGGTTRLIAREKAGILKSGRPAVAAAGDAEAAAEIAAAARAVGAPLRVAGPDFSAVGRSRGFDGIDVSVRTWRRDWGQVALPLLGVHQADNAALACAAYDALAERGLVPDADLAALRTVTLPGRLELVAREPVALLIDAAHNDASAAALAEFLRGADPPGPRVLVFAATRDKDWPSMLRRLVPQFDHVVLTKYLGNARSVPVEQLAAAPVFAIAPVATPDPAAAWAAAKALIAVQKPVRGLICAAGSFFLAAELRNLMLEDGFRRKNG